MIDQAPISVVIPSYNRAAVIVPAIRSVLNQSLRPLEVIVVDDGSVDETRQAVESVNDPIVRYVRQDNSGANAARNRGIEESSYQTVAFHDSDDIWLPEKLKLQWTHMQSSGVAASFGRFIRVTESSSKLYPVEKPIDDVISVIRETAFHRNFLSTQTLVVDRDVILKIGAFDPLLKRFQDWDVMMRLVGSVDFAFHWEPLALVMDSQDSITRNYTAGINARKRMLNKYEPEYSARRKSRLIMKKDILVRQAAQMLQKGRIAS
ncbi:glycosyltransferase family A protein [Frigidibacter sp.]|uniref:glycosyltransferase family 2 protein n=1 Tax=Frigidibacter sp. TaxID=2586418 RepID=UPI002736450F|nr:glycosyltransferase family A protein [Frigidibacter sp.]MDP3342372.1 glycosyltransferase family A protein [Frigidibacter sp.]